MKSKVTTQDIGKDIRGPVYSQSDGNPNITVVRTYFDCLAKRDLHQLSQLLSDDVVWHQLGHGELSKTYHGKRELFGLFGQFLRISGNTLNIDSVKSIMANGDLVAVLRHVSATKPGKELSVDGVDLMKVQDGKIQEVWLFSEDQQAEDAFWVKQ